MSSSPSPAACRALAQQGRLAEAEAALACLLAQSPRQPELLAMQGALRLAGGDAAAALPALEQAALLAPPAPPLLANLALAQLQLGDPAAAAARCRQALAVDPHCGPAWLNLGRALAGLGQFEQAEAALARGLAITPGHVPQRQAALLERLAALRQLGRLAQAEALAEQALAAAGDDHQRADLLVALAELQLVNGQLEAAVSTLRQALLLEPHHANAHSTLAPLLEPAERPAALAAVEAALEATAQLRQRLPLAFAAARLAGALGRPDGFARLRAANNLRCSVDRLPLRLERGELAAARQRRLAWNAAYAAAGSSACPQPIVFVVGLPRCGSTLVESILARDPAVLDLGEVSWLDQALRATSSPAAAASHYLEQLAARHGAIGPGRLLSDKDLFNHERCQAIAAVFPAARILHLRRNPLDQLLSIYQQNFSDSTLSWAYSLDALVEQYHHYRCTMAAFEALAELPLHTFVYEELVSDPASQLPRLVAACGLAWNDHFLQPERSRRAVYTASLSQVRRPIHSGAVGGWRRFEAELRPWAERLEALGYATGLEGA